jgi:hypothetical protein
MTPCTALRSGIIDDIHVKISAGLLLVADFLLANPLLLNFASSIRNT